MIRVLIEGDIHSGDYLGLAHPDHWPKRRRKLADTVWQWRQAELKAIGRVDIHILGGDLVAGPGKKDSIGLLTTDMGEQAEWAEEVVGEVKADHRYFTYGTPYHVIGNFKAEDAISKAFATRPRETWRIGPLHGVKIMDRHVVGRSDIPYGQGTQLWKEWVRDQLQAAMDDFVPADIHIRHHVHYFFQVRNGKGSTISSPCWQLPTPPDDGGSPYPWTLRTMYYDVGLILLEIDKSGEVFVRPRLMPLKMTNPKDYECPEIRENTSKPRARSR
jgi:hypothetical protein